jgi:hypothetical protein
MNAILRDECEAPVLTNEVIEVHLIYLRPAIDALAAKVDQANNARAAGDLMLGEKIDQTNKALGDLSKVVLKIDSRQAAVLWVGSGLVALITLAIGVGKAFKWF